MPVPEGMTRMILIAAGAVSFGFLPGLDAFDALVQVEGGLAFLLVGDDAVEEIRFRRADRGPRIRYRGLRGGVSSESQRQQRDGKSAFQHDAKCRECRQALPGLDSSGHTIVVHRPNAGVC
ncbi:MAG: hypothetical protein DMG49_13910 [Acidobacteria bacterium]|nr:MAG: hypothetical protein DMG49_13910 [Acidobacteriota bacterium]